MLKHFFLMILFALLTSTSLAQSNKEEKSDKPVVRLLVAGGEILTPGLYEILTPQGERILLYRDSAGQVTFVPTWNPRK
jgi:hypothetical protein